MNNLPLLCTLVGVAGVAFSILLAANVKAAPAQLAKEQLRILIVSSRAWESLA
jgi:hypothetical protein